MDKTKLSKFSSSLNDKTQLKKKCLATSIQLANDLISSNNKFEAYIKNVIQSKKPLLDLEGETSDTEKYSDKDKNESDEKSNRKISTTETTSDAGNFISADPDEDRNELLMNKIIDYLKFVVNNINEDNNDSELLMNKPLLIEIFNYIKTIKFHNPINFLKVSIN